jgi:hypothetical protein
MRDAVRRSDAARIRQIIGDAARRQSTINIAYGSLDGRELDAVVAAVRDTPLWPVFAYHLSNQERPAPLQTVHHNAVRAAIKDPEALRSFNRLYVPLGP